MAETTLAQRSPQRMQYEVVPAPAALGAEIRGIDITQVDDTTFRSLHDVWLANVLLIFPPNTKRLSGPKKA